jgi:predicted TPR repeat methyltransferase
VSLFDGTAEFYQRYRSDVPASVASVLVAEVDHVPRPRHLLDVGTGTGFVVRALRDAFDDIIGVDPDADMLEVAERELRPRVRPGTRLSLIGVDAEDFEPPTGWLADLVTVCRTFHWLDQPRFLRGLDHQVSDDGAVAIFGDNSVWAAQSPWKAAMKALVQEYLGEKRLAGTGTYRRPWRPYRDVLAESAFSTIHEVQVPVRRVRTAGSVIGYLHSTSFAAPHLFGNRLAEFDTDAAERLRKFSDDDTFVDDNEFGILIGRRP